ncbi:MAG: LptF/LptG family permease [Bacteroidales bacterium]|jgi:lipopolysaccharide export system permease protein|nr:LptF/LptG family permease [Bacteroidales bacterium]
MKKLYSYMLKQYLGPFVFTFFIALFILLLQFLWKYIDDLVGKGLEWYIIAKLMFYASSTFVPLALPLAILLSSLMTFGNLGEQYELVAMKAAGISLRKAMKPLVYLSVFLSIAAFLFSNYVLPVANLKFGSLLYDVRQQKLAFNLTEGIYYQGIENYVIRAGRKDKDNKTIYDITIYDHTNRMGNTIVTTAEKGYMEMSPDKKMIIFTLFDGTRYADITNIANYRKTRPFESTKFDKQILTFDLTEFQLNRTNEDLFKSHYTMLNIQQLNEAIDSLSTKRNEALQRYKTNFVKRYPIIQVRDSLHDKPSAPAKIITQRQADTMQLAVLKDYSYEDQNTILDAALKGARAAKDNLIHYREDIKSREANMIKHEVVWHQKFKLSIACLIFFFIGAPLGAIIRKGGLGLPVVVSVLFFVMYHIISITGEKAVKTGEWNVDIGIWLSTLVILPLGLFLTFKATTDAQLMDTESWQKFFKRLHFKKK